MKGNSEKASDDLKSGDKALPGLPEKTAEKIGGQKGAAKKKAEGK